MSKFNTKTPVSRKGTGALKTSGVKTKTHEGGDAFALDAKSELFTLAVTNMVGQDTFYEKAGGRDERFRSLIHEVTKSDPAWVARFIPWLRSEANMRSAAVVAAAEYVKAGGEGGRTVIRETLSRADEPSELLAYWMGRYGKRFPAAVKRGVADAIKGLYNDYTVQKYDSKNRDVRFGDVIQLVHPSPDNDEQSRVFKSALDRRYGNEIEVKSERNEESERLASDLRSGSFDWDTLTERLEKAGWTWERLSSYVTMDRRAWEAIIPTMGYMALLRNLRNFEEAGVSADARKYVRNVLADPERVAKSRQFPYRFYTAWKNSNQTLWGAALTDALDASVSNIPVFDGTTLVLIDDSGSMQGAWRARDSVSPAEKAGVFGGAIALRNPDTTTVVSFESDSHVVPHKGKSVMDIVRDSTGRGGATNTDGALVKHWKGQDRVIILTDMQAWPASEGGAYRGYGYGRYVNQRFTGNPKFMYNFDLAGYGRSNFEVGKNGRFLLAGFSDAMFKAVPLLERGQSHDWPF